MDLKSNFINSFDDNLEVFISTQASHYIHATEYSLNKIERRVAFDIGSGVIRMQISDVDLITNRITNVLLIDSIKVALREDLIKSSDENLSPDIQNQMVNAISMLMKRAALFNPQNYYAVATESFRLAKNADALIKRIKEETGLLVTIISQNEEGILGFLSAASEINSHPQNVISWDIGGGSFQITARNGEDYFVYEENLGATVFLNALLKIQSKRQISSPNPISRIEVNQALQFIKSYMKEVPSELHQKLKDSNIIVLGIGINPLWYKPGNLIFTQDLLLSEIEQHLDLDDQELRIKNHISPTEASFHIVSNLILIYGIMKFLDIHQVRYVGTKSANAVGLLLSTKYWQNEEAITKCDMLISSDAR